MRRQGEERYPSSYRYGGRRYPYLLSPSPILSPYSSYRSYTSSLPLKYAVGGISSPGSRIGLNTTYYGANSPLRKTVEENDPSTGLQKASSLSSSEEDVSPVVIKAAFSFKLTAKAKVCNRIGIDSPSAAATRPTFTKQIGQLLTKTERIPDALINVSESPSFLSSAEHAENYSPSVPSPFDSESSGVSSPTSSNNSGERSSPLRNILLKMESEQREEDINKGLLSSDSGCDLANESHENFVAMNSNLKDADKPKGDFYPVNSIDIPKSNGPTSSKVQRTNSKGSLYASALSMGNAKDIAPIAAESPSILKQYKKFPAPQPPLSKSLSTSTVSADSRRISTDSLKNKGIENIYLSPRYPTANNCAMNSYKRIPRTQSMKKYPAPSPPGAPKTNSSSYQGGAKEYSFSRSPSSSSLSRERRITETPISNRTPTKSSGSFPGSNKSSPSSNERKKFGNEHQGFTPVSPNLKKTDCCPVLPNCVVPSFQRSHSQIKNKYISSKTTDSSEKSDCAKAASSINGLPESDVSLHKRNGPIVPFYDKKVDEQTGVKTVILTSQASNITSKSSHKSTNNRTITPLTQAEVNYTKGEDAGKNEVKQLVKSKDSSSSVGSKAKEEINNKMNALAEEIEKNKTDVSANSSLETSANYRSTRTGKLSTMATKFESAAKTVTDSKKTLPKQQPASKISLLSVNKLSDLTSKFEKEKPLANNFKDSSQVIKSLEKERVVRRPGKIFSPEPNIYDTKRRNSIGGVNIGKFGPVAKPNDFIYTKKSKMNRSESLNDNTLTSVPTKDIITETQSSCTDISKDHKLEVSCSKAEDKLSPITEADDLKTNQTNLGNDAASNNANLSENSIIKTTILLENGNITNEKVSLSQNITPVLPTQRSEARVNTEMKDNVDAILAKEPKYDDTSTESEGTTSSTLKSSNLDSTIGPLSEECEQMIKYEEKYIKILEKALSERKDTKKSERLASCSSFPKMLSLDSRGNIIDNLSVPSISFDNIGTGNDLNVLSNKLAVDVSKSPSFNGTDSAAAAVVAIPKSNNIRGHSDLLTPRYRKQLPLLDCNSDKPYDLLSARLSTQSAEVIRFHSSKHSELMEKIKGPVNGQRRRSRRSTTPESVVSASEILKDAEERLARAIRSPLSMSRTSTERERSYSFDSASLAASDSTQLDILMPLPTSDEWSLCDKYPHSPTPFDSRESTPTPTPKKIVEETQAMLSDTDILLRKSRSDHSLRKSFSRSMSGIGINRLAEATTELSEQHSTAHLAGERLEAEQAERMKLEKEVSLLHGDVQMMTSVNEKIEMEKLTLRNEILQHAELNGDIQDFDEAGDASLYKRKYEWGLREIEVLKKQLKQQKDDDLDQLLLLKKQLEKKIFDANEEADEQRQVVGQLKKKSQRLQAEMNDLKILLEEQSSRNNLLEKKQRKFDQDTQSLHEENKNERLAKDKIQRERDQILSQKYSFEQEVSTLKLELELKEENVTVLKRELADLSFTGKVEEETALLKKVKHDLELRVKDQEEELDDLAGQVQMLEAAKIRLEMSIEQTRKENRKEGQQRDEELEEVRMGSQKKIKALEVQLEAEHDDRTQLVREKHDLERRLADAHDRTASTIDEDYVHRLKKELKKTKALLRDSQTMLEKSQTEGSSKLILRQLKTQLEDAEFAKTTAIKARQSAEADVVELQTHLDESFRAKKDADDRYSRILKEKSEMQTQLEESEEEVAEVMKKFKATVSQLSVDQITISEQTQLMAELEHDKQILHERLSELSSKVEVLEGETANIHTQKRLQMKIKELESKLELELTTRQRLDNQISRLKDQVDRLGSECDVARMKESQAVDHGKKIVRQLRDAKVDLSGLQQKHTDVSGRKQEMEKQLELSESEIITLKSDLKLAFKRIEDLQQALQGDLSDSDSDLSDSGSESETSLSSYLTTSMKYPRSSISNETTPPSESQQESPNEFVVKAASERSMSVISEDFEDDSYKESFA